MVVRQVEFHTQEHEFIPHLVSYTKTNFEWTVDLNIRAIMIKLLEENLEVNLGDIRLGNDFVTLTPGCTNDERRLVSWASSKLKSFHDPMCTITKVKRATSHSWRKYLHITHLIKELYLECIKNANNSIKKSKKNSKRSKDVERTFFQRRPTHFKEDIRVWRVDHISDQGIAIQNHKKMLPYLHPTDYHSKDRCWQRSGGIWTFGRCW